MDSPFLRLFTDSILANTLIPFYSQAAFFAMRAFGGYDMHEAAAIAVAGATVGHLINWAVGKIVCALYEAGKIPFMKKDYDILAPYMRRYCVFILLLSFVPLFEFFSFAAGIFNIPLRHALPLIVIGQAAYYGYYLFN